MEKSDERIRPNHKRVESFQRKCEENPWELGARGSDKKHEFDKGTKSEPKSFLLPAWGRKWHPERKNKVNKIF